MSSEVDQYLKDELAKAQRSYRNTLIAMGAIVVVVFGYFQWLKSEVRTVLDPPVLAEFMVNEMRAGLPDASTALKENLRNNAPEMVRFVLHGVVDNVLPMVRDEFQRNLRDYSREVTTIGTAGVMTAFEEVVRTHKESAVRAGQADPNLIAAELSEHMKAELAKRVSTAEDGGESLQEKLDHSVVALRRINDHLKTLARKRNLSREDEMGKRLITTWWTFLDNNSQDLPGVQVVENEAAGSEAAEL